MDKKKTCPLCEKRCQTEEEFECVDGGVPSLSFNCEPIGRLFYLDRQITGIYKPTAQLFYTAIVNDLLRRKGIDRRIPHYCYNRSPKEGPGNDVYVDVTKMQLWEQGHEEKVDQSLLNLYRMYGEKMFELDTELSMRCMLCTDHEQALAMKNSLLNYGYIAETSSKDQSGRCIISKEGWRRIDELRRHHSDRTGFVALAFRDETKEIREVLKKSIYECGFEPVVIDEQEYNNQIVPEIEKRIQKCRFLVMDCSVPNMGAYYEAGMATGLGKQVIICCNESKFRNKKTKPHFDIAQHSIIIWKDHADLETRLVNRICCTVEGARLTNKETELENGDVNN